ncbi:uncharacterized protein LOC133831694 [Humulus lupulus]|uniref:uncharacterized protein LOC133831694 n=1 Tax=Humulus lupulus TaxID=3486 RepID=UPI002B40B87C|nr:uncharacterized protein LOC133831694 [Humulus lupulus]
MIGRTASKIVYSNGRTGKSYAVAAAAAASATVNKIENHNSKADEILSSASETQPTNLHIKGKRTTMAQRRALVEAFVHNYKATNDGKFPSPNIVVKQIGGSYYVAKKIVQEMQSQLKLSALDNVNQNGLGKKETTKVKEPLITAKKLTGGNISVNLGVQNDFQTTPTNHVKIKNVIDKHIEAGSGSISSSSADKTFSSKKGTINIDGYSEFAAAQHSLLKGDGEKNVSSCQKNVEIKDVESKTSEFVREQSSLLQEDFGNISHACRVNLENEKQNEDRAQDDIPGFVAEDLQIMNTRKVLDLGVENVEDNKQKKATSDDLQDKDVPKDKTERHEGTPEHKPAQAALDDHSKQTSVAEFVKKPSLWGNLKSFADGIFNMWRKS